MRVYPTKATALNVKHPNGSKLVPSGSDWPPDGFTFRMIVQHIATEDPKEAFTPPATTVAPAAPSPAKA